MKKDWLNRKVSMNYLPFIAVAVIAMKDANHIAALFTSVHGLQFLAMLVAAYALYRGPISSMRVKLRTVAPPSEPISPIPDMATPTVGYQPTRIGRLGNFIATHLLISIISGVIGFSVIKFFVVIFLSSVLGFLGVPVQLPKSVAEWRRNFLTSVKEHVLDIRENVGDKFGDVKDAVTRRMKGEEVDYASDEFWGGPPNPKATEESLREEAFAFDAFPPEKKLAILATAKECDLTDTVVNQLFSAFEAETLLQMRVGRSAVFVLTPNQARMYELFWGNDAEGTHSMDAASRMALTRLSPPPRKFTLEEVDAVEKAMSASERLAWMTAFRRLKQPLPADVELPESISRDGVFYQAPDIGGSGSIVPKAEFDQFRETLLTILREEEASQARAKRDRFKKLAGSARDKAHDFADAAKDKAQDLGDAARGKARNVAAHAKEAVADAREDAMDAVRGGVKDAAKDTVRSFLPW